MVDAVNYTDARKNLAALMDRVNNDSDTIIITRQTKRPVVLMSLDEYNSMQETLYLLRSPENAKRLYQAMEEFQAGKFVERELVEVE